MCYSKDKQKEIIKILCGFRQAFPNTKADSDTMLIYSYALMDMEVGLIYAAMMKILHTSTFFPSVSFKSANWSTPFLLIYGQKPFRKSTGVKSRGCATLLFTITEVSTNKSYGIPFMRISLF